MKYTFTLITLLFALNASAQKNKTKPTPANTTAKQNVKPAAPNAEPVGKALIKGHISNYSDNLLDYGAEKLLGYTLASIPVDKNGDFETVVPIETRFKEIYLQTGDGITLSLSDKDTVYISWDAKDFKKTLDIKTANPNRAPQIKKINDHLKKFETLNYNMRVALNDKNITDSAKFSKINALYNEEIHSLLSEPVYEASLDKAIDIYFQYTDALLSERLLGKYELYIIKPTKETAYQELLSEPLAYKTQSITYYKTSSAYRDFLFNYVRFQKPFDKTITAVNGVTYKTLPFSPGWKDYYSAMAAFQLTELRDWFVTKSIMFDFAHYLFNDAVGIYNDFIGKVETPFYADTLKTYYTNVQRLKPGVPAPGFSLKDESGKQVSLSSFKGKTVYIDFWGVGCGPCIYAIKNHVPALHEKYKDKNIVFINICVDSDETSWKRSLADLKLHGVNLIAEGWTKNPTCKAYNINAIPHYYLIDGEGKIVNNNAQSPGSGIDKEIDKLLK